MFSGIIAALGHVVARNSGSMAERFEISWDGLGDDVAVGDSIAVNGVCLTVVAREGDIFSVEAVEETLKRSTVGDLDVGSRVNLERPVVMGGTLDGHIVQGHVDGIGTVVQEAPDLRIAVSGDELRYVVEKGSITVDGVSLTVVSVDNREFSVAVIPHTAAVTTLGIRRVGDRVNLEFDVIAKYVERLLTAYRT